MKDITITESFLSQDSLENALGIWNKSSIFLKDIRHCLISAKEPLKSYCLPTQAFMYISGGKTEVILDQISYKIEYFGIFHGGKGCELSILPACEWVEYYLVLYKAGEPPFYKRDFLRLLEKEDPFRLQYGFAPDNPIFFAEQLRKMYERWKEPVSLNLFYGKAAFYQLVYEIYAQLYKGNVKLIQPDIMAMAKHYINEHYNEAISIAAMAEHLGVSYSHLHRLFRKDTGNGPQGYLTKVRMEKAKYFILESCYSIKDIARSTGFYDEFHFSNVFKKYTGMSPVSFRENYTCHKRYISMDSLSVFPYNKENLVSLGELKEEGENIMFKQIKNKAVMAAAISIMLLFSGCGSAASVNNNTDNTSTQTVVTQESESQGQSTNQETRTIVTTKGDVEVPANPQRVIVHYLMGDAISMGIIPIGVSQILSGAAFEENIKEAVDLGSWDFEMESVMSLEPDLIITVNENQYEELSKIAPTVYVPYGTMTTKERITFLGEIFNKEEEAKKVLEDYTNKLEQAKEKLKEQGFDSATVTILQTQEQGNSVAGAKHAMGVLVYKELGLLPPQKVQEEIIDADEYWGQPSMEVLEEYCGDYLIHLGEIPESVSSNDVWNIIPAVANEKVVIMDTALTYYTDVVSSDALVDEIVDNIISLSEKDK